MSATEHTEQIISRTLSNIEYVIQNQIKTKLQDISDKLDKELNIEMIQTKKENEKTRQKSQ